MSILPTSKTTPWTGITEGRMVHVRCPGVSHCQPAIVVRKWGDDSDSSVNLQVFRDGTNDHEALGLRPADRQAATRWATSVPHKSATDPDNQSWHWPERV